MTLEKYGVESSDPLLDSLENLQDEVHDVDSTFTERDAEIARSLAKCKKELNRAVEIRIDELRDGGSK